MADIPALVATARSSGQCITSVKLNNGNNPSTQPIVAAALTAAVAAALTAAAAPAPAGPAVATTVSSTFSAVLPPYHHHMDTDNEEEYRLRRLKEGTKAKAHQAFICPYGKPGPQKIRLNHHQQLWS